MCADGSVRSGQAPLGIPQPVPRLSVAQADKEFTRLAIPDGNRQPVPAATYLDILSGLTRAMKRRDTPSAAVVKDLCVVQPYTHLARGLHDHAQSLVVGLLEFSHQGTGAVGEGLKVAGDFYARGLWRELRLDAWQFRQRPAPPGDRRDHPGRDGPTQARSFKVQVQGITIDAQGIRRGRRHDQGKVLRSAGS